MIFDDFDLKVLIWGSGVLGLLFLLTNNMRGFGVCLVVLGASYLGRVYFLIRAKRLVVPSPPPVVCRPLKSSDSLKFNNRGRNK